MISKYQKEILEAVIIGNADDVKKYINDGVSIYSRTEHHENALHLALMKQHTEIAQLLWSIYESDLKFVREKIDFMNNLWISSPILIGCGVDDTSKIDQLYNDYQEYEGACETYQPNCVVILLKKDNFTPNRVLCLSPQTKGGQLATLQVVKYLFKNGFLDLNEVPRSGISLVNASAAAGMTNIYNSLLNYRDAGKSTDTDLYAIRFGHVQFLAEYHKQSPINFYNFFQLYCIKILHSDKWAVIRYFAEQIIAEKQMTWRQILNFRIPSTSATLFFYTIQNNLIEIAENLLEHEPNLNADDKHGHNPMYYLTWSLRNVQKYRSFVMKVIEMDANQLNVMDKDMCTILHKLVMSISLQEVKQIYEKYSNAKHIFFKIRIVALQCIETMISLKQFETIKFVIDNAKEQIDSDLLYSILNKLAASNNVSVFEHIMSMNNFDFSTKDSIQNTNPLMQALKYRNLGAFKLMLSKMKSDHLQAALDCTGYNLLLFCIVFSSPVFNSNLTGMLECMNTMEHVKEKSPDPVQPIDNLEFIEIFDELIDESHKEMYKSYNLLHISVAANNIYAVKKLLQLGLQIDACDNSPDQKLPIDFAHSVEMFELLNAEMPSSYIKDYRLKGRLSPLHRLVRCEPKDAALKLIAYILDNGGDIDEIDEHGKSAIFYARHKDTAELLLKYKPNLNLISCHSETPIHHALGEGQYELGYLLLKQKMVEYSIKMDDLKSLTQDTNTSEIPPIFTAIRFNNDLATLLLGLSNLNVFVLDPYTLNTPLHAAAYYGKIELVDRLIERGLQMDSRNIHGDTPLNLYFRHSAELRHEYLITFLKYNPEVNIKNDREMSPILYASVKDTTGDIICELLARGANITDRELDGPTAYENMTSQLQNLFKFLV